MLARARRITRWKWINVHSARSRLDQAESQASVEPPPSYAEPRVFVVCPLCDIVLTTHKGSEIILVWRGRKQVTHYTHAPAKPREGIRMTCYAMRLLAALLLLYITWVFIFRLVLHLVEVSGYASRWLSPVLHAPFCFLFGALFVCQLVSACSARQTSTWRM